MNNPKEALAEHLHQVFTTEQPISECINQIFIWCIEHNVGTPLSKTDDPQLPDATNINLIHLLPQSPFQEFLLSYHTAGNHLRLQYKRITYHPDESVKNHTTFSLRYSQDELIHHQYIFDLTLYIPTQQQIDIYGHTNQDENTFTVCKVLCDEYSAFTAFRKEVTTILKSLLS